MQAMRRGIRCGARLMACFEKSIGFGYRRDAGAMMRRTAGMISCYGVLVVVSLLISNLGAAHAFDLNLKFAIHQVDRLLRLQQEVGLMQPFLKGKPIYNASYNGEMINRCNVVVLD